MKGVMLWRRISLLGGGLAFGFYSMAQTADGNQGLSEANTLVRGYYETATNLMFGIAAIIAIIGAIRVFSMWVSGEPHMGKAAGMWFTACVFLVLTATVIKSFFGL